MKIRIHSSGNRDITIPVPNSLLFSPTLLDLCIKSGMIQSGQQQKLPKEALRQICSAIKNYYRTHGSWEIVHAESACGDTVIITI